MIRFKILERLGIRNMSHTPGGRKRTLAELNTELFDRHGRGEIPDWKMQIACGLIPSDKPRDYFDIGL